MLRGDLWAFRGHVGDQGYAALWLRLCNVQDTICSVLRLKLRSIKASIIRDWVPMD